MSDRDIRTIADMFRNPRPIAGGADDPDPDDKPDPQDDPDDKPEEPDFKAEADKWKALARKHEKQAKANADAAKRLKEAEEADKSEVQKANDKTAEAEKRAAEAEAKALRYEIAQEKEVPSKLMRFLTGSTREELEESADALLEATKSDGDTPTNGGRPKEKLKPGASPESDDDSETDPAKLAARVPRMY